MPLKTGGLYAQLLDVRWLELAEVVRRLHDSGGVEAFGTFRVQRGTNRLARFAAWLAGLPAECEAATMRLVVTPVGAGEEWRRHFGDRQLVTRQMPGAGLLLERHGSTELALKLDVVDGALHYQSSRVALRIGFIRIPLPRWLAPRVTACEKAGPEGIGVCVEVCLPLLGRLISYQGTLTTIESKPCGLC